LKKERPEIFGNFFKKILGMANFSRGISQNSTILKKGESPEKKLKIVEK
jgi:hypothetical protein